MKTVKLTSDELEVILQCLDFTCKGTGLRNAAALLNVAIKVQDAKDQPDAVVAVEPDAITKEFEDAN